MNPALKHLPCGTLLCLLFLCSPAAEISKQPPLPPDVPMNQDAGRGGLLIVKLRLESGGELPFILDTGSSMTILDKSLESKLGRRLDAADSFFFGVETESQLYDAPTLYLGNTPLKTTGNEVAVVDFKQLQIVNSGQPVMGLLGIDILRHYCLQLDFKAGRIRFLDVDHVNKKDWGKPFPLTDIGDGCLCVSANLAGVQGSASLIDSGNNLDGWLLPELFQRWTNQAIHPGNGEVRYPDGAFGGETYPYNIHTHRLALPSYNGDSHLLLNGIGIHFLARHLVTFDFPKRTMYLKRTSALPLFPKGSDPALRLLKNLKQKDQVPGWPKRDKAPAYFDAFGSVLGHYDASGDPDFNSIVCFLLKDGDSSVYHYTIVRDSKDSPWRLQKASRTDRSGQVIQDYPLK